MLAYQQCLMITTSKYNNLLTTHYFGNPKLKMAFISITICRTDLKTDTGVLFFSSLKKIYVTRIRHLYEHYIYLSFPGEAYVTIYATPSPFLLNQVCINSHYTLTVSEISCTPSPMASFTMGVISPLSVATATEISIFSILREDSPVHIAFTSGTLYKMNAMLSLKSRPM